MSATRTTGIEKYDHSPSGRLVISVDSSHRYDATDFKDAKRTSVADTSPDNDVLCRDPSDI